MDPNDRDVIQRLSSLRGVLRAVELDADDRREIAARRTPEAAENRGVAAVLARPQAFCIFKDASFRPPPEPTVLLVDDDETVLGREILPGEDAPAERRVAHLGRDFVLFPGKRPHGRYRFVLPPVRFPELEGVPTLARVVSASPDTPQDDYLRARYGVAPGRQYASILIGCEVRNP